MILDEAIYDGDWIHRTNMKYKKKDLTWQKKFFLESIKKLNKIVFTFYLGVKIY